MTWRPLPRRRDEEDPKPLRPSLDRLARRVGAPETSALTTVFAHWEDAVGAAVADHAQPLSLHGTTLVVGVDEAGWATQLRYLANDVLARLATAAGTPVADRLEVRVTRPKGRGL